MGGNQIEINLRKRVFYLCDNVCFGISHVQLLLHSTWKMKEKMLSVLTCLNLPHLNTPMYTPQKNLRTSTYFFPLFFTESLIFKIENIFKFKGHLK